MKLTKEEVLEIKANAIKVLRIIFICYLIIIAFVVLSSCGARKTELKKDTLEEKKETKTEIKKDIVNDSTVKKEIKVIVTDSTKEEIEETIIETPKQKVTKRKIKRSIAIKKENNTNILLDEKSTDNTVKTKQEAKQSKTNQQTKNIDRKQFDIIGLLLSYWWLWLLIIILLWAYRKYKNILLS